MANKYDYLKEEVKELSKTINTDTGIARELIKKHKELKQKTTVDALRKIVGIQLKKARDETPFTEFAEQQGIDIDKVHSYWDKSTKEYSVLIQENRQSTKELLECFTEVVEQLSFHPPIITKNKKRKLGARALKATRTDCHIGMNPNPDNSSLFKYEYNEKIYKDNTETMFQDILKESELFGKFEVLFLEDLGDRADGWSGYTTRGGHELPQNMSNAEVFKVAVETEVSLIQKLVSYDVADKIVIRSVHVDNHSGDFSEIINEAVKMVIERIYGEDIVEVHMLSNFMETYTYGDHAFILTHGKDDKVMKRGLPLHLDDRTVNFINEYIDHYEINSKWIHVQKGDLHQVGYNRTKKFDYRNFMSFAPPSSWVQGNFGDCYAGYSLQVIEKDKQEIKHIDKFFEMKKVFKKD